MNEEGEEVEVEEEQNVIQSSSPKQVVYCDLAAVFHVSSNSRNNNNEREQIMCT